VRCQRGELHRLWRRLVPRRQSDPSAHSTGDSCADHSGADVPAIASADPSADHSAANAGADASTRAKLLQVVRQLWWKLRDWMVQQQPIGLLGLRRHVVRRSRAREPHVLSCGEASCRLSEAGPERVAFFTALERAE